MILFQPVDIALFLISFAACVYCIVLSRRLATLQNTKDGLGATITACTQSISSMSLATRSTTAQAKQLASELSELLIKAQAVSQKIEAETIKMEKKHRHVATKIAAKQSEAEQTMHDVLEQHKKHVAEIVQIMHMLPKIHQASAQLDRPQQMKFKTLVETKQQGAGQS